MALYIRDHEVWRMAQRLAATRQTTVTDAVRRALARELASEAREVEAREAALRALFERFDETSGTPFGEDEMYDDHGLPR